MTSADQVELLDAHEAFAAMRLFVDRYAERAVGYDLVDLLGDIHELGDGRPADPAAWEDWLQCVTDVKAAG